MKIEIRNFWKFKNLKKENGLENNFNILDKIYYRFSFTYVDIILDFFTAACTWLIIKLQCKLLIKRNSISVKVIMNYSKVFTRRLPIWRLLQRWMVRIFISIMGPTNRNIKLLSKNGGSNCGKKSNRWIYLSFKKNELGIPILRRVSHSAIRFDSSLLLKTKQEWISVFKPTMHTNTY